MADSIKARWSGFRNESCSCLIPTECTRDDCGSEAPSNELRNREAFDPAAASTRAISHSPAAQEVGRATPESSRSRGLMILNPTGWETSRAFEFYSTPAVLHRFDLAAVRLPVNSTNPILSHLGPFRGHSEDSTTRSSVDRSPRLYNTYNPSQFSIRTPYLTLPPSPERRSASLYSPQVPVTASVIRSISTPPNITSNTFRSAIDSVDVYLHGIRPRRYSLSDSAEAASIEPYVLAPHVSSLSAPSSREPESYTDESDSSHLRPHLPARYREALTPGGHNSSPDSLTEHGAILPRTRRASTELQAPPFEPRIDSHPNVNEDGDDLPALLSMSDGSDSDSGRPSSPDTATDVSSHDSNGEARPRFLHPGTPIQTELPELQSLLRQYQVGDRVSGRRFLLASEASDQYDGQISWDEDFTGDVDRARELLDGLDLVDEDLVRRYEEVRGDGGDICTVCRDPLLRSEGQLGTEAVPVDIVAVENFATSVELPFQPPCSEMSIYALPCTHLFHMDCLLPWLSLKTTCPTCRLDLDPNSFTLRVRGWGSTPWSPGNTQSRVYVNTDSFGKRFPWRRPHGPSLEEWVRQREQEQPDQKERRVKHICSDRDNGSAALRDGSQYPGTIRPDEGADTQQVAHPASPADLPLDLEGGTETRRVFCPEQEFFQTDLPVPNSTTLGIYLWQGHVQHSGPSRLILDDATFPREEPPYRRAVRIRNASISRSITETDTSLSFGSSSEHEFQERSSFSQHVLSSFAPGGDCQSANNCAILASHPAQEPDSRTNIERLQGQARCPSLLSLNPDPRTTSETDSSEIASSDQAGSPNLSETSDQWRRHSSEWFVAAGTRP